MGKKYYAVAKGRNVGIFESWAECKKQVQGYSGAVYKSFKSFEEALEFYDNSSGDGSISFSPAKKKQKERTYNSNYNFLPSATTSYLSYGLPKELPPPVNPYAYNNMSYNNNVSVGMKRSRNEEEDDISEIAPPQKKRKRDHIINIYTDGSCFYNGQKGRSRGGIGVYFGENDPRNIGKKLDKGVQTNNRAELMAFREALKVVKDNSNKVVIFSDSQWSINVVGKLWKAKKHLKLIEEIRELLRKRGGRTEFRYVPAHTGKKDGNHFADMLARKGAGM